MNVDYKRILWSLVVGFLVGAALMRWSAEGGLRHLRHGDRDKSVFEMTSARLELTPGQQAQLKAILEENRQKVTALRAEFEPRFESLRQGTRGEIRRMLEPKQQDGFDAMTRELDARRKSKDKGSGLP